jgi:hypothetical protein
MVLVNRLEDYKHPLPENVSFLKQSANDEEDYRTGSLSD